MATSNDTKKTPVARNKSPTEELILKKKKFIVKWISKGLTGKEIAAKLGISYSRWNVIKKILDAEEEKEKKKPGRDPILNEILEKKADLIREFAAGDLNNSEIAKELGISKATWYRYLAESPIVRELISDGKNILKYNLESSLARAALGYKEDDSKVVIGEDGKKRYERNTKHYPPNITAVKLLLQKIDPEGYGAKNDGFKAVVQTTQEVTGSGDESESKHTTTATVVILPSNGRGDEYGSD